MTCDCFTILQTKYAQRANAASLHAIHFFVIFEVLHAQVHVIEFELRISMKLLVIAKFDTANLIMYPNNLDLSNNLKHC